MAHLVNGQSERGLLLERLRLLLPLPKTEMLAEEVLNPLLRLQLDRMKMLRLWLQLTGLQRAQLRPLPLPSQFYPSLLV